MSMSEWAENEVKLACKRENPDWDGETFDYGCSCYQSALKAYKSLCDDGHSGFSFSVTKNILIRLMNSLPLTPIEDTPDMWNESIFQDEDKTVTTYQCKRMNGLFKRVHKDGTVTYSALRDYCQEITNPEDTYTGGVGDIIDEMFPITMPYYPSVEKYKIVVDTFLAEGFEGDKTDFNTKAILYVITPEKERVEVNRYYGEKDGHLVEITKGEYNERLKNRKEKKIMEELIVNEFNERWVKVDDDSFIKNVDYHIDTCFSLSYVAEVPSPDSQSRWIIGLHGGKNGDGKWNEYLLDMISTYNKLKEIFENVTVLDIKNDVPDDVFDMRIVVSGRK